MDRMTDRGQLLLAGAFVLAVALVGLTLVLTSGGYTTTLAGQDNAVDRGTDALTVREAVLSDLDRYLRRANSEYDFPVTPTPETKFRAVLPALADGYRDQYGRHGRLVDLGTPATLELGHEIELSTDGNYDRLDTDSDGSEVIVTNSRTRNVTLAFSSGFSGHSIRFRFQGATREWVVEILNVGGDWVVTVDEVSSMYTQSCTRTGTGSDMFVDLSAATIDGNHCPPLEQISFNQKQYSVSVEGDLSTIRGRMWMTVKGPGLAGPTDDAIYSARVPFRYDSPSVTFETELRSAPGEIR